MRIDYQDKPKYIQIETTIICNATCWFCPQKKATRRPKIMEERVWKKIVDDTRDLGITYRPFLLNEPFVDNRMAEIIRYIKQDPTAKVELNSNGAALTPGKSDEIIEAGIDKIKFSVDGIRRKTFDESRGISYDKVYANVAYFIEAANAADQEILTSLRMIKFPGTEEEQAEYREYWEAFNPTAIEFTELYRYPWEGQTKSLNLPCIKIVEEMFFYVDGRATLCCWDTAERQTLGDVNEASVLDIWNGDPLDRCRRLLDKGKRADIPLCSRCDAYKDFDFETYFEKRKKQNQDG
ncbi:MAG: radical SAM protein [Proteobacteria bacterium]|nr:radical SAM protein [Pseudomonadota bacterium]